MKQGAKIILTGFPKSGKTAIGRELSKLLGCPWFDLDSLICGFFEQGQKGLSCREIWDRVGESEFRQLEFLSLESFLLTHAGADESFVMSLGGGAAVDEKCRTLLEGASKSVPGFVLAALVTEPDELFKRFSRFGFPRVIDPERPRESFDELYTVRDKAYRSLSSVVCDSGSGAGVEEVARRLHSQIKEFLK